MIIIKTATGKEFECDSALAGSDLPRCYFNIINSTFEDVVMTVMKSGELPFVGYEGYKTIHSITNNNDGIRVTLKP